MALFEGALLEPEERPTKPPSQRELARRRAAERKAARELAAANPRLDAPRAPRRFDLDQARAANLAEADRRRRRRFAAWGLDPDAPDCEEQYVAEEARRNQLVQEGFTFIRGRQEPMESWTREWKDA